MRLGILLIFMAFASFSFGQEVGGVVTLDGKPLPGATLRWMSAETGAISDEKGKFSLPNPSKTPDFLITAYPGYKNDTLVWEGEPVVRVYLSEDIRLEDVVIEEEGANTHIDRLNPVKTEIITERELEKGACCDLAGCFNTEASVQPVTTDVLTNAKELRILGLSGVYNQILVEGFPLIQGLSYTYGISSVPGPLVRKIYVAKGANSVLQGYESIVGQINVELKDPDATDQLYLNAYMNSFLEKQFNGHATQKGKNWSTLFALNGVLPAQSTDRNGDGFLDLPRLTRYHLMNKWMVGDENTAGFYTITGARFIDEFRLGGQVGYDPETHQGDTLLYGQTSDLQRPEFYSKTGYNFSEKQGLVLFLSGFSQRQESWFGLTRYKADQQQFYGNLQYELRWADKHDLKTGASFRYFDLDEDIRFSRNPNNLTYDGQYHKREVIPGIFAENTFRFFDNKLTWIAGARLDRHNQFGNRFTPRSLWRYNLGDNASLRASVGWGWRTVNLFPENINLLASSRNILINGTLEPETAVNYGVNYTHTVVGDLAKATFGIDLYRTEFTNQIFPDYDTPGQAIIANFTGESVSNGFQAEFGVEILEQIELKAGYNYLDVYRRINNEKVQLPFNSRHKINGSASYNPISRKWHADVNVHWYGVQRLARTSLVAPGEDEFSEPYTLVNAQLAWTPGRVELYGGCENIFNFRLTEPIVGYQNPFGPNFDTSNIWGPMRGRELYLGIRFKWNPKN